MLVQTGIRLDESQVMEDLEVTVESGLSTSQQCTLTAGKANDPHCAGTAAASRPGTLFPSMQLG